MGRRLIMSFSVVAYAIFFATFLYLIAFVGDIAVVPRTVDSGPAADVGVAAAIDLALIALFGLQHSIMARPGFKTAWTRLVSPAAERSLYVLLSSALLILLFWQWRPIYLMVWRIEHPVGEALMWILFALGFGMVLLSTFLLSHFELFGLKQAWLHLRGRALASGPLAEPFFYKLVRHPLYSGFLIAFWATPEMTGGHLLFALGMTAYILVAIRYEERDLVAHFGEDYVAYRRRAGMLAPRLRRRA